MIKAKVTKKFRGVIDGQCLPQDIHPGTQITGDLARVAIQEGWAERVETGEPDRLKGQASDPGSDDSKSQEGDQGDDDSKNQAGDQASDDSNGQEGDQGGDDSNGQEGDAGNDDSKDQGKSGSASRPAQGSAKSKQKKSDK